jgi:hypothetical protein
LYLHPYLLEQSVSCDQYWNVSMPYCFLSMMAKFGSEIVLIKTSWTCLNLYFYFEYWISEC